MITVVTVCISQFYGHVNIVTKVQGSYWYRIVLYLQVANFKQITQMIYSTALYFLLSCAHELPENLQSKIFEVSQNQRKRSTTR